MSHRDNNTSGAGGSSKDLYDNRDEEDGLDRMEIDDTNDEEHDMLHRLGSNYRRFSENNSRQEYLNDSQDEDDEDEENIQLHVRRLNEHNIFDADDDENDDDDDEDDENLDDNMNQYQAMQMLASAFLNGTDRNTSRDNRDNNRADGDDFQPQSRNDLERMMMSSFFEQLIPGGQQNGSRIGKLVTALGEQDDAYLTLETLNELSTELLMTTGMFPHRLVSTYKTTQSIVSVIQRFPEDMNVQLVACRCLFNLAEINFTTTFHEMIQGTQVIEILNSKLFDISYMELAEQALQTLEIISRRFGRKLIDGGSIPAALGFLDFFTIHAQRKALKIAANASEYSTEENYYDIKSVFGTIENVGCNYSDQQCVESAWIFICNVITSFQNAPEKMEDLITETLLKRMCLISASGLSRKNDSIVGSKTLLRIVNSMKILATILPKISLSLLKDCHLEDAFVGALTSDSSADNITVDSILSCPKDLMYAFLKLIASTIPFVSYGVDVDYGNYLGNTNTPVLKEILNNKLKLYLVEDNEMGFFKNFSFNLIPVILEIFSSTVDYKLKRLILVIVLRIISFFNGSTLVELAVQSKLTNAIIHPIIQSKKLLETQSGISAELKASTIAYGGLLITQILTRKAPEAFVPDFESEGLISHLHSFSTLMDQTILNADQRTGIRNDDNEINEEEEDFQLESDLDTTHGHSDYNSELEESDDHIDADEDNDPITEDVNMNLEEINTSSLKSTVKQVDVSLDPNSVHPTDIVCWYTKLNKIICEIISDYESFANSHCYEKPEHIKALDQVKNFLESTHSFDSKKNAYEAWSNLWKDFASIITSRSNGKTISSYEMISSGLVESLTNVLDPKSSGIARSTFTDLFCSTTSQLGAYDHLLLVPLVEILKNSLERTESFDIIASDLISNSANARSKAKSITKTMHVKLVLEDDTSKELSIVVQAIATFESLEVFVKRNMMGNTFRELLRTGQTFDSQEPQSDFYYDFFINDILVPMDATVFGEVYRSMQKSPSDTIPMKNVFDNRKFKIVAKKVKGVRLVSDTPLTQSDDLKNSTIGDQIPLSILNLLRLLYELNSEISNSGASEVLFLSSKLTAKLNRQLEEPLVVASGIIPDWATVLPRHYSFLFPLDTRIFFLKSTSYGYSRLMSLWADKSKEEDEQILAIGRPIRHKLRLSRKALFPSAAKVMESYSKKPGLLEIEYFDEAGSGMGPTLEFYANVSKEFSKEKYFMWRGDYKGYNQKDEKGRNTENNDIYINDVNGLFPRPLLFVNNDKAANKILELFRFLGRFLARSFLDSRIVDFRFNPTFFKLALDVCTGKTNTYSLSQKLTMLEKIDYQLASSISYLSKYLTLFENLDAEEKKKVQVNDSTLENLSLSFNVPGYPDIKLGNHNTEDDVTCENLEEYIYLLLDTTMFNGVHKQITAFIDGFSEVFPFSSLILFSPQELVRLSGNEKEDWSLETLMHVLRADHGYNAESPQIKWLVDLMSNFEDEKRRTFLQFLTGAPRLPIGGFKSLTPSLTVVLKHTENELKPDDYLPSVMTCANYLKLPAYSSREIMESKLNQAMREGADAFLLS